MRESGDVVSTPIPAAVGLRLSRVFDLLFQEGVLEPLIGELVQSVGERVGALREDRDVERLMTELMVASVGALEDLAAGTSESFVVPTESVRLARLLARRGLGVEELAEAFAAARSSALSMVRNVIDMVDSPEQERVELALATSQLLLWWTDANYAAIVSELSRERENLLHGANTRRLSTVRALLTGHLTDVDVASESLEHNLRQWHVGCLLWDARPSDVVDESLHDIATRSARALGAQLLVLDAVPGELWFWLSAGRPEVLDSVAILSISSSGTRCAVGRPGSGLEGFRLTHQQAQTARSIFPQLRHGAPLVRYEDVEIASFLGSAAQQLGPFVFFTLGELARDDKLTERLRHTLEAYFASNFRIVDAAERLSVHANTLRYRLQQAEELLGHPVTEHRLEVELALRAMRQLIIQPRPALGTH